MTALRFDLRPSGVGVRLGVFTDAPWELAVIAVSQLADARRVEAVEAGAGALDRLRKRLGADATVIGTRARPVELAP
jgi:hypothetical protein